MPDPTMYTIVFRRDVLMAFDGKDGACVTITFEIGRYQLPGTFPFVTKYMWQLVQDETKIIATEKHFSSVSSAFLHAYFHILEELSKAFPTSNIRASWSYIDLQLTSG